MSGRWGDRPLGRWGWREPWSSPVGPVPITVAILLSPVPSVDSPPDSFLPVLDKAFRVPVLWYSRTPTTPSFTAFQPIPYALALCPCRVPPCRHRSLHRRTRRVSAATPPARRSRLPRRHAAAQTRPPAAHSGPRRPPATSSQSPHRAAPPPPAARSPSVRSALPLSHPRPSSAK